jgi:hypothetical protein
MKCANCWGKVGLGNISGSLGNSIFLTIINYRYRPSRWTIWARSVYPEIPIIHSNAPVESSWSVVKNKYIRKGSRPKPEILIDIIMNLYLPRHRLLVEQHRDIEDPVKPTWYISILSLLIDFIRYHGFVMKWKRMCKRAKEEFNQEGNDFIWTQQQTRYHPSLQEWHCGCLSYANSAYHLCKHLIRLYIGDDGLISNKPRMPFYGEVWRQSTAPTLWIHGLHSPDQLIVGDLRPNPSRKPILGERPLNVEPDAPDLYEDDLSDLPELDSDDEMDEDDSNDDDDDEDEDEDEDDKDDEDESSSSPVGFIDDFDEDFFEKEELYEQKAAIRDEQIAQLRPCT